MTRCAWLAALVCMGSGCSGPSRPAVGSSSRVVVWSSSDLAAEAVEQLLDAPFGCGLRPEPAFQVERTRDASRVTFARQAIVLVSRQTDAMRSLHRLLPASRWPAPDELRIDLHRDLAARGQIVVLVSAPTTAILEMSRQAIGDAARESLECGMRRRLRDEILHDVVPASGLGGRADLGFRLRLPSSYEVRPKAAAWPEAVEFVRADPVRTLLVFWIDRGARPPTAEYGLGLLRDVVWRLHHDTLIESATRTEPAHLGKYEALSVCTVWQNRAEVCGGPLRTWFVHDTARGRLYGITTAVCAPGRETASGQRELHALAETFRLGDDP